MHMHIANILISYFPYIFMNFLQNNLEKSSFRSIILSSRAPLRTDLFSDARRERYGTTLANGPYGVDL